MSLGAAALLLALAGPGAVLTESGLEPDPGLAEALQAWIREPSAGDGVAAFRRALWRAERYEFQVAHARLSGSGAPEEALRRFLAGPEAELLPLERFTHAEVVVIEHDEGFELAVGWLRRVVEPELPIGDQLRYRRAGEGGDRLHLSGPAGVEVRPVVCQEGSCSVSLEEAPEGALELVVEGPLGPEVALLLPGRIDEGPLVGGRRWPRGVPALEAALLEQLNSERVARGLDPLAADPALTSVARAHAADMATRGYFGHRDPSGVDVEGRLQAADVAYRRALENVARVSDPGEVHPLLMASPGHRGNILDEQVGALGIGVHRARRGGRELWWVAQVMVDPLQLEEEAQLLSRASDAVGGFRSQMGLAALTRKAQLDGLAQEALDWHLAEEHDEAVSERLDELAETVRFRFADARDVSAALVVADEPEALADLSRLLDPRWDQWGLAIHQPRQPLAGRPAGMVWAMLVLVERGRRPEDPVAPGTQPRRGGNR